MFQNTSSDISNHLMNQKYTVNEKGSFCKVKKLETTYLSNGSQLNKMGDSHEKVFPTYCCMKKVNCRTTCITNFCKIDKQLNK